MFKVGDAVRLKAGISSETHRGIGSSFTDNMDSYIGEKLTVDHANVRYCTCTGDDDAPWNYDYEWLEPWNDSEEWDGEKWVPKKCMPETITVNGVEYVRKGKTSAEKLADALNDVSNTPYIIFGKTIANIKRVYATADGNVVTARYELEG